VRELYCLAAVDCTEAIYCASRAQCKIEEKVRVGEIGIENWVNECALMFVAGGGCAGVAGSKGDETGSGVARTDRNGKGRPMKQHATRCMGGAQIRVKFRLRQLFAVHNKEKKTRKKTHAGSVDPGTFHRPVFLVSN
jgi:hypothetical protein